MTVATIKYYIREGLLPAGTPISATQAEYDSTHVDRLRLIRALVDVGRLSITTVRELLATLDGSTDDAVADDEAAADGTATGKTAADGATDGGTADGPAADNTADDSPAADETAAGGTAASKTAAGDRAASKAAAGDRAARKTTAGGGAASKAAASGTATNGSASDWIASDRVAKAVATAHEALSPPPAAGSPPPERALAAMATLGWEVDPDSAALRVLEAALAGLDAVQLVPGEATLRTYAEAALTVAEIDVTGVPSDSPSETVRYVVIGTVMYEPVLIALRRLAQQHVFRQLGSRPRE